MTRQLELNLGVRYDHESNMLNNDYVTPKDRVDALRGPDVERYGIAPPAGQTYAQSLAKRGIGIEQYISDGSSRKAFKRAFAPRLGASFDLFGDRNSVIFGGWGRSYDRTMANNSIDELQKNSQLNGEIWLIRNDYKMPFADQFTIGLRQAVGTWNTEVALSRVHAKNQFIWFSGNRDANGSFARQNPIDPLWGGPAGFGQVVLGDFVGETRTDAVLMKAEKPYTTSSGWGVNIAYTYSDAKTTHNLWDNDVFDWIQGRYASAWHSSKLVDRHRVVAAGVVDNILPWGMTFSAKAVWASGMPRRLTDCSKGFDTCRYVEDDAPAYRQIDVGTAKELKIAGNRFTVRADVLNLFNTGNFGGFDDWVGPAPADPTKANAFGGDNQNLGKPNDVRGNPRTVRVMVGYSF